MMDALTGAYPRAMGDDGFLHTAPSVGPMRGAETGGEGTAAGAIHAAFHIAAALVQRARTGEGAYIDISGAEGVISQAWIAATYALNEQRIADRSTMPDPQDGEIDRLHLSVLRVRRWPEHPLLLHRAQVLEELLPRRSTVPTCSTATGRPGVPRSTSAWAGTTSDGSCSRSSPPSLSRSGWLLAAGHDIAMGPAYRSVVDAAEDPHLMARGTFHADVHPVAGPYTFVKEAGIVAGQPYRIRHHAPALGAHSREILAELGFAEHETEALLAAGAVVAG